MAIELKCPKCGGRLVYWGATGALLKCPQCEFGWGNEELWQELIRTKELLDIECSEHEMCHTQMLKTTEKLERTRKALGIALDWLREVETPEKCDDELCREFTSQKLVEIKTVLEQKG